MLLAGAWGGLHAQNCNGTPVAGSVSAAPGQACPGTPVTLSLNGQSTDGGITFHWQSSPDGLKWVNMQGGTGTTMVYNIPADFTGMYFRVAVTCTASNQTSYSTSAQVTLPLIASYVQLPFTEGFEGDWIHICADGQLPQPTAGLCWSNLPATGTNSWRRDDDGASANWPEAGYGAYASGGAQGSQHSARFHSTYSTSPGMLDLYVNCNTSLATKKLSFDYNNADGTDSLEVLLSTDGGSTFNRLYGVYTTNGWENKGLIFSTSSPTTIIRFKGVEDNGNSDLGIDNISVQQVVACTGTPPQSKAVTSSSSICVGSQFTLTAGGLPANVQGFAYQWQSSATGTSGWLPIAGATDTSFTTTETAKTWYRAVITCTLSGDSSTSNTVAINLPSPMKGTYTINSAAATAGTNFTSFTDAASALQCAGIAGPVVFNVKVASGPYNEQLLLTGIAGISAINTITFKGNGNTIKYSAASQGTGVVVINGSSYITLDSLVIDASPAPADTATHYGVGIVLQNQADNNTVQACKIVTDSLTASDNVAANYAGIMLDGTDSYNIISNNSISGGNSGIRAQSGATGNQFVGNHIQQFRNTGIAIAYAGNIEDSLLITGNFISSLHRVNGSSPGGISVFGGSNIVITKNRVYSMYSSAYMSGIGVFAINEMAGSKSSVTNNLLYNINGGQGTAGIVSVNYNSMLVAFNTVSVVNAAMQAGSTIDGILIAGGNTTGTTVENNLVYINAKGNGSSHAINLSAPVLPGLVLDYNNYFVAGTADNAIGTMPAPAGASATLATWQQATGLEAHSVNFNPLFEDTTAGDYKPASVDLDNRGIPVTGTGTDIVNVPRGRLTPDIGAYEFKTCVPVRGAYTINSAAAPGAVRTFISFNDAYEALRCGIDSAVTFNVKPGSGPYNEQLNMRYIDGSSAKNTITFKGNGATIHFNAADEAHKAVVEFNGTQHVTLDSLVIDATPPAGQAKNYWGIAVQMYNNSGGNTIHGCTIITDSTGASNLFGGNFEYIYTGIALIGNHRGDSVSANHNMFDHNTIRGGVCGIGLDGTAVADSFVNNNVSKFQLCGIQLYNSNSDSTGYNDSLLVRGNEVHGTTQGGTGIEVLDANNVTVEKNIVHDLKSAGNAGIIVDAINNKPGSKVYVVNNLVFDIGRDSTAINPTNDVFGIINYCEGDVFIEHNTVALHNSAKTGSSTVDGILNLILTRTGEDGNTRIENNLVAIEGDGKSKAACIHFINQTPANQKYTFDHNNYYTDGNPNNAIGYLNSTKYISNLSDWVAQTGLDSNSVSINAMFANAATGNYRPTNYRFDNLGTPVGVTTDIVDSLRSTTHPDIGCFEFRICPPKFAAFSASKQLVCIEDPIAFVTPDTSINFHTVDDWAWNFGNGTSSSLQNPVTAYSAAGTYNVQLTTGTNDGCIDDTTGKVTVVDCFKQLFIPNAFTPNGDGLNDVLKVYGNSIKQIRFMVFNQWGEKLFETTSLGDGWDGTQNGKKQPSGVYMYVCQVTMNDGRETIKKGSVNLIR